MAKKPSPRDAMFAGFERSSCDASQQAIGLLDAVSERIERAQNPFCRSLSEFELEELADVLRRGASPSVEFEPDLAVMAMKAAETSKLACLAALEILGPHLESIKEYRAR